MDVYRYFAGAQPVELEDMLSSRELRVRERARLQASWDSSIICFTLNIPGKYKLFPLAVRCFERGKKLIELSARGRWRIVGEKERRDKTGCTAFFGVDGEAEEIKRQMAAIEDGHPLGRLFDIDVYRPDGKAVSRSEQRRCLICGGPVRLCAGARAHSAQALAERAVELMAGFFDEEWAEETAGKAVRALMHEVCTSTKPGLVDRFGSGAHRDMDIFTFMDSGCTLFDSFARMCRIGMDWQGPPDELLDALRLPGMEAEEKMLRATGGVNTHKGAIFSLGILCAAAGYMRAGEPGTGAGELFSLAAAIAAPSMAQLGKGDSHGQTAYEKYGMSGIRGEAASGFPTVRDRALPEYTRLRARGLDPDTAGVLCLLHIMAWAQDTNIVSRGGPEALEQIQGRLRTLLDGERGEAELMSFARELDRELTEKNISPGGCADLLAAAIFVHSLFD